MTLLSVLATITGVFLAGATIPQIIKIFQRKSAKDISPITYFMIVVGAAVWVLYGLEIKNFPIVLTNVVGIATAITILLQWHVYGRKKR